MLYLHMHLYKCIKLKVSVSIMCAFFKCSTALLYYFDRYFCDSSTKECIPYRQTLFAGSLQTFLQRALSDYWVYCAKAELPKSAASKSDAYLYTLAVDKK